MRKQGLIWVIVVAVIMWVGIISCFAQMPMRRQGTADLKGIKAVDSQPTQEKTYQIPITQTLPLADNSGQATVTVQTITVTKNQLQHIIDQGNQRIAQMNTQITDMQKTISDAQAEMDAIVALENKETVIQQ